MMTYIVQQTLSNYINSLDNDSLAAYINAIDGINNYTRDYLDFFKTADGLYEKGKITNEDIKEEVKAIVETKDYFILDSRDVFKKTKFNAVICVFIASLLYMALRKPFNRYTK